MTGRLPPELVFAWDQKLVRLFGGRPFVAAVSVAVLLMASFFSMAFLTGIYGADVEIPTEDYYSTFGLDPFAWAAIVTSLLAGYACAAASYSLMADWQELDGFARLLGLDVEPLRAEWTAAQSKAHGRAIMLGWVFFAVGLGVILVTVPGAADLVRLPRAGAPMPWFMQTAAAWFLVVTPPIFYLLGKGLYHTVKDARFLAGMRTRHLKIDLFDLAGLKAVTRMVMRQSLVWIIGSSIGSLYFLSEQIERVVLLPFFLIIVGVALVLLFLPLNGVHRKIVSAKACELSRLRAAIAGERKLLLSEKEVGTGAALAGLIALEERTKSLPDWPLDFSTMGRFSFYLAIPLVSWVGGALVERVVDVAMG